MSFRKRKNVDYEPDVFTFEVNKVVNRKLNGVVQVCTVRTRVNSDEHKYETVPPIPSLQECLSAGIGLKEVPCEGLLDSRDNLDYNHEGVAEGIYENLSRIAETQTKTDVQPTNE